MSLSDTLFGPQLTFPAVIPIHVDIYISLLCKLVS